ncbi:hypothetical protein FNAPI_1135 [Fusarium napiforme]|uniref:Uncharacterized protein n=1 Tax=Fusarium napiforme TaxID=42672 RepID=A0A8H5K4X1_9HYPO|nr:hypothetical protein FNAPI_1135 [Fusarium napiforme]
MDFLRNLPRPIDLNLKGMLLRLGKRPGWDDPFMQGMLQRFIDTFENIKGDMGTALADDLALFCVAKLCRMTKSIAMDITTCPVYQELETGISFAEWFFLACWWQVNFPSNRVVFPQEVSAEKQQELYYGPKKKASPSNAQPENGTNQPGATEATSTKPSSPLRNVVGTPNGDSQNGPKSIMNPIYMARMVITGQRALERVDGVDSRVQLVENSQQSLVSAKEQQAQKILDLEKALKDQGDAMETLKQDIKGLRGGLAAQIRDSIQQQVKAELATQQSLSDNKAEEVETIVTERINAALVGQAALFHKELHQNFEKVGNETKAVESKLVEQIEGLRHPLSNMKKELAGQKEKLDVYAKSHDELANAWNIADELVSQGMDLHDGSRSKRKNSMSGEGQGSAKRQSTLAGPEATGDNSFTSTHGSD